jgi:anti-anti-sigma factor
MEINHTLENGKLTLFLKGELNSFNAEEAEKQIEAFLGEGEIRSIVLDLAELVYIASAGLRIIVRLKQRFPETSLVRVPDDVYDVFHMVGFENVLHIERL